MKIKQKVQEKMVTESRNTAITIFVSAALIPLLLTLLIGFNLGSAERTNDENLRNRVEILNKKIDTIQKAKVNVENEILMLHRTFAQMDSILILYRDQDFKELNDKLSNLSLLVGIDQTTQLQQWDGEKARIVQKFKTSIDLLNARTDFNNNLQLKHLQNYAVRWFDQHAQNVDFNLFLRKITIQQNMGSNTTSSLEEQIDRLKESQMKLASESSLKESEKINLEDSYSKGLESWKKEREGDKEYIAQLQREMSAYQTKTKSIKDKILIEIDEIHKQTLPDLIPKKWLQKNDQQINDFKKSLEFHLDVLQRHTGDLN